MKRRILLLVLLVSTSSSLSSWAQQPSAPLMELPSRIGIGDSIQVVDANGTKVNGRFDGVGDRSLRLTVKGTSREFPEAAVREVKLRRPDRRWDGTLIGGGVGAAAAFISTAGKNDPEQTFYERIVFVPLFTGIGLGAGALLDFAIRKYDTVLQISPVVWRDQKGFALRVSF